MMSWLRGTRSHERWERRAHAYVDGELKARDYLRFEEHLESCERCQALLDEVADLRASLQAMPEAEPPRSFRLTPEMVRPKSRPVRGAPAPPAWAFRAAQVTAGIAIAGFVSVVTIDALSGEPGRAGDDAGSMTTMAGAANEAPVRDNAGGSTSDNATATDALGSDPGTTPTADDAPPATIPPYTNGTSGSASTNTATPSAEFSAAPSPETTPEGPRTGPPTEEPSAMASATSEGYQPTDDGSGDIEKAAPLPEGESMRATEGATEMTTQLAATAEPERDRTLIRSIEALLAIVAVAAVVMAFFARGSAER